MATPLEQLRELLGERIPPGGSETDTMFLDTQLSDLLDRHDNDVESALIEGWQIKVAEYASLVDTAEGTSKRSFSDLRTQAQSVLTYLEANAPSVNRTRIFKLKRS